MLDTCRLSSFDLFSLGMVIKGAWIYREVPSYDRLEASLAVILRRYPDRGRFTVTVPQELIGRMKEESGAGTNAVLCKIAVDRLLEASCGGRPEDFGLIEVADLRTRCRGVGEDFFGNFSQAVMIGRFGQGFSAREIHERVSKVMQGEKPDMSARVSLSASHYSLPYFAFNPSELNTPLLRLMYVNNQLKFRAFETDFGCGLPVRVMQAELPDMIKFWQSAPGADVEIIYSGYAARLMKKRFGA